MVGGRRRISYLPITALSPLAEISSALSRCLFFLLGLLKNWKTLLFLFIKFFLFHLLLLDGFGLTQIFNLVYKLQKGTTGLCWTTYMIFIRSSLWMWHLLSLTGGMTVANGIMQLGTSEIVWMGSHGWKGAGCIICSHSPSRSALRPWHQNQQVISRYQWLIKSDRVSQSDSCSQEFVSGKAEPET